MSTKKLLIGAAAGAAIYWFVIRPRLATKTASPTTTASTVKSNTAGIKLAQ